MNQLFTNCTRNRYAVMIKTSATKNMGGGMTNLKYGPRGVSGISNPMVTIYMEVNIKNWLGLLSMNGIFPVRIIWITRVWVRRDSRNQPVVKRGCEA